MFCDAFVEIFHQLRFGGDHGAGFVLQGLEGVAEDLEERTVLMSHEWNVLGQLVFFGSKLMMPAIGSRGYSQFVVTIPTDRERRIGEYGRGREQRSGNRDQKRGGEIYLSMPVFCM